LNNTKTYEAANNVLGDAQRHFRDRKKFVRALAAVAAREPLQTGET
jgi:hypothetical protein